MARPPGKLPLPQETTPEFLARDPFDAHGTNLVTQCIFSGSLKICLISRLSVKKLTPSSGVRARSQPGKELAWLGSGSCTAKGTEGYSGRQK